LYPKFKIILHFTAVYRYQELKKLLICDYFKVTVWLVEKSLTKSVSSEFETLILSFCLLQY